MLKHFLATLAALLLILDVGCLPLDASNDEYLLPLSVKPLAYHLSLMLTADQTKFYGSVDIYMIAVTKTDTITLHCEDLDITSSTFFRTAKEDRIRVRISPVKYDKELQRCAFTVDEVLAPTNNYVLALEFNGTYNNDLGISKDYYTTADGTKKWITQTEFKPTYARRVFPCFDEPAYKARFTLRVGRPQDMITISNMPLMSSTVDMATGIVWDEFEETPPMSTFLLAFVIISDYVNITDPQTNSSMWLPTEWVQDAEIPLSIASEAITLLREYTGIAHALPKLDHVVVPNPGHDAVENWGVISYRNNYFACDNETCSMEDLELMRGLLAHKISHQWFGNLVTLNWWSYVWLNEGFATYFEYYITSMMMPNWRIMEYFCVSTIQEALHYDVQSNTHPLTSFSVKTTEEISSMFSDISYMKGASIVYMLHNILSEETFKRGVSEYLTKNAYGNVIEDNLWESLRKAMGHNSVDIARIMKSWTHESGFPLVTVQRENNSIILTQEKYLGNISEAGVRWWIPLTYTTSSDINFNNTKVKEWFPANATTHVLDLPVYKNEWIILNIGYAGFYRVNYDMLTWKLLTKYLCQCNTNEIPPVSRAQVLDDVFTLAASGHVDYKAALDMASFLQCEVDFVPWDTATTVFIKLIDKLYITEAYGLFKSYMLELALEAYNKYSFEKTKIIDEKLAQNIIVFWACELGHTHCQSTSVKLMNQMMSGVNDSIPIDLMETIMCTAVKVGSEDVWFYLLKLYVETNNTPYRTHIINAMGCTMNRGNIHRLLTDVFNKTDFIREDDVESIVFSIVAQSHNVPVVIDFFFQNFTSVYKTLGDDILEILELLAKVQTTAEDAEKLRKIVALLQADETPAKDVAVILDNIGANEEWMSRHYDTVYEWLKEHQSSTANICGQVSTYESKGSELHHIDSVMTTNSSQETDLHLDRIPEVTTHQPHSTTVKSNFAAAAAVFSFSLLLASLLITCI